MRLTQAQHIPMAWVSHTSKSKGFSRFQDCSLVAVVVAVFSQLCCRFFAMSCIFFVKCRPGILNHSFFAGFFHFPHTLQKSGIPYKKNGNLYTKNGGAYFGICVADFRIRGCAFHRQQLHICTGCFARTLRHVAYPLWCFLVVQPCSDKLLPAYSSFWGMGLVQLWRSHLHSLSRTPKHT